MHTDHTHEHILMRGLFLTFSPLSHDLAAHPDRTPASHRLPRRTPFFISGDTRRSFSSWRTNGLDSLELELDSGHCHYNIHRGFYTQGRAGHAPTSQPTSSPVPPALPAPPPTCTHTSGRGEPAMDQLNAHTPARQRPPYTMVPPRLTRPVRAHTCA